MSDERYSVTRLDEIERRGAWTPIRAHFDIQAFGVNAWTAGEPGAELIGEHAERLSGHQELYLVLSGHATFTVAGEEIDAPVGTLVFVRDPATRRKAVARDVGTTVVAVGAKPGEPYRVLGWEYSSEAYPLFEQGEYERAYDILSLAAERHPEAGGVLYNLACAEARLGKTDEALEHLRRAIELFGGFAEYAREDPDFESIRGHPDFAAA